MCELVNLHVKIRHDKYMQISFHKTTPPLEQVSVVEKEISWSWNQGYRRFLPQFRIWNRAILNMARVVHQPCH